MPRENDKVFLHVSISGADPEAIDVSIETNIPTIPSLPKIEQKRQKGGFVMWRLNSGSPAGRFAARRSGRR